MTMINIERLRQLAQILDRADQQCKEHRKPAYNQKRYLHRCGTPACALGHWAAAHPDRWDVFIDGGPTLKKLDPDNITSGLIAFITVEHAAYEFGLTVPQARELFGSHGCGNAKTSQEAAAYIRAFIDCHDPS